MGVIIPQGETLGLDNLNMNTQERGEDLYLASHKQNVYPLHGIDA